MHPLQLIACILGILACALVIGIVERGSPEATAGLVQEANARKELPGPLDLQRGLSLPLQADATVTQSGAGEPPRTRFYIRSQQR